MATDTFGRLDVLFNNAGIFPADDGGTLDTPPETWHRVMEVNLQGVWLGCRAAIPAMLASGGGSIVNVASFVALMGAATAQVAYTASKGGVLALTREIAVEYARRGIRANSICPGPIDTPLLAELLADPDRRRPTTGARPHGPLRPARGDRRCRPVPRLRRVLVHDRRRPGGRRWDHGGLRDAGVGRRGDPSPDWPAADWTPALDWPPPLDQASGVLTLETLPHQVRTGDVDTVVVAFPDLQGRPVGKRVTGTFFLDEVAAQGIEVCDYLLACDVDMDPLPGYRLASWETGYGDLHCRIDPKTLRPLPWLPGSAFMLCDLFTVEGEPVEVSPRRMLRRQIERAAEHGLVVRCATELEFYLFRDSFADAAAKHGRGWCPTPTPSRTTSSCRPPARST